MARASPQKIVNIGAKGALRKIFGSVGQNGFIKKYQRGDPLGRQGVESLKGASAPAQTSNLTTGWVLVTKE